MLLVIIQFNSVSVPKKTIYNFFHEISSYSMHATSISGFLNLSNVFGTDEELQVISAVIFSKNKKCGTARRYFRRTNTVTEINDLV